MIKTNKYQVIREDQLVKEAVVYIYRGDEPVKGVIEKIMREKFIIPDYYLIEVLMSDTGLLWEGPRSHVYVKTESGQSSH